MVDNGQSVTDALRETIEEGGGALAEECLATIEWLDEIVVYYMSQGWPSYSEADRRPEWNDKLVAAQSAAQRRWLKCRRLALAAKSESPP